MRCEFTTIEGTFSDQTVDFGNTDSKGRSLGAVITTWEEVFTPSRDGSGMTKEPGHYFCMRTQSSRDGEGFGAGGRTLYFKTPAERDAAIAKYIKGAQKRYGKNNL